MTFDIPKESLLYMLAFLRNLCLCLAYQMNQLWQFYMYLAFPLAEKATNDNF